MVKKRHNPKEIKYCQHNGHNQSHAFKNGETCYLIKKLADSGHSVKMAVCQECYESNEEFELVEEIKIASS